MTAKGAGQGREKAATGSNDLSHVVRARAHIDRDPLATHTVAVDAVLGQFHVRNDTPAHARTRPAGRPPPTRAKPLATHAVAVDAVLGHVQLAAGEPLDVALVEVDVGGLQTRMDEGGGVMHAWMGHHTAPDQHPIT